MFKINNCHAFRHIVVALKEPLARKIGYWIREAVRDLYEMAISKRFECVIFTMTKKLDSVPRFEILVILCLGKEVDNYHKLYGNSGYEKSDFEPVNEFTVYSKTTYMLRLGCRNCTSHSQTTLPIQYRKIGCQNVKFRIQPNPQGDFWAVVQCFKRNVPRISENSKCM